MPPRPRYERVPNARLRSQRLLRGWSQEDVAAELIRVGHEAGESNLGVSAKMVSAWERGEARPRPPYPKLLCAVFAVTAPEIGLVPPARLDADAIPGGDDMERRTFLETMLGAALVPRALAGLSLEDFIHEPRRYLTAWATTPTRELVPPALGCLWLAEASGSGQAACEASILLAWLAYDLGDDARMRNYYRDAAEYGRRAGSTNLLTYTLLSWAQDTDDGPQAVRLVEQAKGILSGSAPAALRQYATKESALAWSKVGDGPRASDALARLEPAELVWPMAFPISESTAARSHGLVALRLEQPDTALPALHQKLDVYGPEPNKHKAYVMGELGLAYRQAGDPERAGELWGEAQALGRRLGLRRLTAAV